MNESPRFERTGYSENSNNTIHGEVQIVSYHVLKLEFPEIIFACHCMECGKVTSLLSISQSGERSYWAAALYLK